MNPTDDVTLPAWQVKALVRIVAELRAPSHRDAPWFASLADRVGVDMEQAERLNPKVAA